MAGRYARSTGSAVRCPQAPQLADLSPLEELDPDDVEDEEDGVAEAAELDSPLVGLELLDVDELVVERLSVR